MKVILGLGNPGLRYRYSRHNLGFAVIEKLAKKQKIRISQKGFKCLLGQGQIQGQPVVLLKSLTFMNLSGQAARAIVKQKRIKPADLLVIVDDINLPLGKIRIRSGGSDGGHLGLRSIIEALGSKNFVRLRIGIGAPTLKAENKKLTQHVLGRFNKKETKVINQAVPEAASACVLWATEGIQVAMNKFN
ncbi:MAG: aminoacyl-tRNA hydrolase [Omnitrophica bacterium]|nr:aminoacyl-tRNA hydrolase [Candidatus Omnitrophota bacterium]